MARSLHQVEQVHIHKRQHRLGFGIAQPAVELEHLGTFRSEHESREQSAHKWSAFRGHLLDGRPEDRPLNGGQHRLIGQHRVTRQRRGSDGAHSPGIGALIPIERTLVITRRRQDPYVSPVR